MLNAPTTVEPTCLTSPWKPIFDETTQERIFYVAARGHHSDIGGIVPGSALADSTTIDQEGLVLDNVLLVQDDRFLEEEIRNILTGGLACP